MPALFSSRSSASSDSSDVCAFFPFIFFFFFFLSSSLSCFSTSLFSSEGTMPGCSSSSAPSSVSVRKANILAKSPGFFGFFPVPASSAVTMFCSCSSCSSPEMLPRRASISSAEGPAVSVLDSLSSPLLSSITAKEASSIPWVKVRSPSSAASPAGTV